MSGKPKLQKIVTEYYSDDKQTRSDTNYSDQGNQEIKFIKPAKDIFVDPIPQREVRVRSSQSAILDRPVYSLASGTSSTLDPERVIPDVQEYLKAQAAQRAIEGKASELDWIGPMTAESEHHQLPRGVERVGVRPPGVSLFT